MKRFLMAAAAAGALWAVAQGATAATFVVDNITMDTSYVVGLTNQEGNTYSVYDSIQLLHTTTGDLIDFLCVDMTHFDSLGVQNPLKEYHTAALTTDFDGHLLTLDQIGQLGWFALQERMTSDPLQLAGLQGAAWLVEGGTIDFRGNTALADATNALVADTHRVNVANVFAYVNDSSGQSGVGVVPEPATWSLMILGFGMLGATLRRRVQHAL
jgi:hypothetical protein